MKKSEMACALTVLEGVDNVLSEESQTLLPLHQIWHPSRGPNAEYEIRYTDIHKPLNLFQTFIRSTDEIIRLIKVQPLIKRPVWVP